MPVESSFQMEFSQCVYLFDIIQRCGIHTAVWTNAEKKTHTPIHMHASVEQNESKNLQQDVQGRIIMWS